MLAPTINPREGDDMSVYDVSAAPSQWLAAV